MGLIAISPNAGRHLTDSNQSDDITLESSSSIFNNFIGKFIPLY